MKTFSVRVLAFVAGTLKGSIAAALGIMLACIAIQVLMRYAFSRPPSWTEEGAMLMFSWAILGGLALGVREGFHVRLDLVVGAVPPFARFWLERGSDLVTAVFGGFLLWSGERFFDMTGGSVSAAIGYPIEALHVLAPLAGGLILLFSLARLLGDRPEKTIREIES